MAQTHGDPDPVPDPNPQHCRFRKNPDDPLSPRGISYRVKKYGAAALLLQADLVMTAPVARLHGLHELHGHASPTPARTWDHFSGISAHQ